MKDEKYIQRCLFLAQKGEYFVAPNPMVGAVLTDANGTILAEGWHRQWGGPHAEVNCFADAEQKGITDFSNCTLYVSLEPCSHYGKTPPCAELIIRKGVKRVVVGQLDPNPQVAGRGIRMLQDAGIEVTVGVLEEECRALNKRFLCLHEKKRPYIILKWAQTADGFLDRKREQGTGNREQGPLVISTPETKVEVHRMRAENMAILVGTKTILLDNPRLQTTRFEGRNPIRITMDRHGRIPADSRIFLPDERPNIPEYPGEKVIVYRDQTDWEYIVSDLGERCIHSVLVEGGRQVLEGTLDSCLWDEIHVEIGEIRIGDGVAAPRLKVIENKEPGIYTYTNPLNEEIERWIVEEGLNKREAIERLMGNEPIQYIAGHTPWMGLDLRVTPDTLIPRPETAELIEHIERHYRHTKGLRVLDIGTGSGCIAIALQQRHPDWEVCGLDISEGALTVARENSIRNSVRVLWQKSDILSDEIEGKWDIIVSNPPYVCEEEKTAMDANVLDWEPSTALFVPDSDPLRYYRRIAQLKAGQHLFFEINERFGNEVCAMLAQEGYSDIQLHQDIYGKDRIVEGRISK